MSDKPMRSSTSVRRALQHARMELVEWEDYQKSGKYEPHVCSSWIESLRSKIHTLEWVLGYHHYEDWEGNYNPFGKKGRDAYTNK